MALLYFYDAETAGDVPEELIAQFPASYRTRYRDANVETVRMQAVGSALLLKEHFGVTSDEQLVRGEHGQLRVRYDPRHLCLSHSGPVTVLAIDEGPVGVDLEHLHETSEPTVRRLFPPSFRTELEGKEDEERDETFTRLWTRLEAALKADGRGLSAPREDIEDILTRYDIQTEKIGDYYVSVATPAS